MFVIEGEIRKPNLETREGLCGVWPSSPLNQLSMVHVLLRCCVRTLGDGDV